MHLNVVPMPKREPEKTDKQFCLEFLDKLKADIESGGYAAPEQMVIVLAEQDGDTFRLSHILVNATPVEAIGMLHMAAGDIADDPPEVNWNE